MRLNYLLTLTAILASLASCQPSRRQGTLRGGLCNDLPCLPGIDTMGLGFDIVRGTSERMQSLVRFAYPGETYVNPFNASLQYAVPQGVTVVDNTHGQQSVSSNVYYNASTYAQSLAAAASASLTIGAFSASASTQYYKSVLDNAASYGCVVDSKLEITLYDITLPPSLFLNITAYFASYVKTLPTQYDKSTYSKFLQLYGTHYVSAATFGGEGHMSTAANSVYSPRLAPRRLRPRLRCTSNGSKQAARPPRRRTSPTKTFARGASSRRPSQAATPLI